MIHTVYIQGITIGQTVVPCVRKVEADRLPGVSQEGWFIPPDNDQIEGVQPTVGYRGGGQEYSYSYSIQSCKQMNVCDVAKEE